MDIDQNLSLVLHQVPRYQLDGNGPTIQRGGKADPTGGEPGQDVGGENNRNATRLKTGTRTERNVTGRKNFLKVRLTGIGTQVGLLKENRAVRDSQTFNITRFLKPPAWLLVIEVKTAAVVSTGTIRGNSGHPIEGVDRRRSGLRSVVLGREEVLV